MFEFNYQLVKKPHKFESCIFKSVCVTLKDDSNLSNAQMSKAFFLNLRKLHFLVSCSETCKTNRFKSGKFNALLKEFRIFALKRKVKAIFLVNIITKIGWHSLRPLHYQPVDKTKILALGD